MRHAANRSWTLAGLLCLLATGLFSGNAQENEASPPAGNAPPTTLPFAPTVPSAPPSNPTYPRPAVPQPPPGDPLCYEIAPIIRAGVVNSRFATLSPSTMQGAVIGRFETGEAITDLGGGYCTVVIPAANAATADSAYNQVVCQLAMEQSDAAFLDDMRENQQALSTRISECPAMARWTGHEPARSPLSETDIEEDYVFTHPDVAVELIVRARHHLKAGQWPLDYLRTLSLVFRTPNPDRPEPPPIADPLQPGEGLP